MIYPVFIKLVFPKEDASKLANEYEWKNSQTAAMFNVVTDIQHQYLDAGKEKSLYQHVKISLVQSNTMK